MKIGIDIRPLRDIMTGIGRYQYKMLEALARIDSINEYILFYNSLSPRVPEGLPRRENFRLIFTRLPGKFLTALWAFTPLISVERFTGNIDIFHSPSFQVPPARNAARVFTVFDLIAITHSEMAIPSAVRHFRPRVRHYAARADLVVAISKATAADVVNHLGVPEEKVVTVYPGTTPFERSESDRIAATKRKYDIKGDYILFVSRLDPRKNLSRLFKAFEKSGLHRELELLVAGPKGWHMDEMFATWHDSECKDKIR
ncbi:MAG: glycosyltransferase, partial [Candidatus Zixiibacteriota bacterium]